MSDLKEINPGEKSLEIKISPNGEVGIRFFAVCWSKFIIENVYSKKKREEIREMEKLTGIKNRGIFCG